uniref:Uncharacterized protein n=1 Tax=Plectus sambesii TaxID=2011161 RepID=A0A914XDB5_9BILA
MEAATGAKFILLFLGLVEAAIGGLMVVGGVLAIVYLSWLHVVGHGIWGGVLIAAVGLIVIIAVFRKRSAIFLVHTVFGTILLLLIFPPITVLWALEVDVNAWWSHGDPDWCRNGCDDEADERSPYYNASNIGQVIGGSLSAPDANLGAWDKFRQAYLQQAFWPERLGQNIFSALNNEMSYLIHGEIPCDSILWQDNCHKNETAWLVCLLCLCLSAVGAVVVFVSLCLSCCTYAQCFSNRRSSSAGAGQGFNMFHSHHSPSVSPVPNYKPWHSPAIGSAQPPQYEQIAPH